MHASLPAGTVLGGRYRIVRLLGAGGMGSVYEAVQVDLGRRVAVKVLHSTEDPTYLERFRREALAAAGLGQPNIVMVTDFQSPPGEPPFLVMELLTGESLAHAIARAGTLPPARVVTIAAQVLAALEAAHAKNIIHRDIKPDNVFLTQTPAAVDFVKLLDFGIAKLETPGPPSTFTATAPTASVPSIPTGTATTTATTTATSTPTATSTATQRRLAHADAGAAPTALADAGHPVADAGGASGLRAQRTECSSTPEPGTAFDNALVQREVRAMQGDITACLRLQAPMTAQLVNRSYVFTLKASGRGEMKPNVPPQTQFEASADVCVHMSGATIAVFDPKVAKTAPDSRYRVNCHFYAN
jgi:hypothetical protein